MDVVVYSLCKKYTDKVFESLAGGMRYKGAVSTINDLPLSGNTKGDLYVVSSTHQEYVWSGSSSSGTLNDWTQLGEVINNYIKSASVQNNKLILLDNKGFTTEYSPETTWGNISGTISQQTDLTSRINDLAGVLVNSEADLRKQADELKQDKLTAKSDITVNSLTIGKVELNETVLIKLDAQVTQNTKDITTKQDILTAGENITIENNVISSTASGTQVYYVQLTGTSGTLTTDQRATLLKGEPTNNFINKDNMLFKCVFYKENSRAIYAIPGESKNHVIKVTLEGTDDGKWELTTYELQPTLTAGTNITIVDNVISASGEPDQYLKTAEVDGNTLKLLNKDGSYTSFTPSAEGGITDVKVDGSSVVSAGVANITLTGKQDVLTADSEILAKTITVGKVVLNEEVLTALDSQVETNTTNIDSLSKGKQDTLTEEQLNATNSGITQDKVTTYDNYATNKQDALKELQLKAVNSGIDSDKVAVYTGYQNSKQDVLTEDQLNATNSGITAEKVKNLDSHISNLTNPHEVKVAQLTDVTLTDVKADQILKWDDTSKKWINADQTGKGEPDEYIKDIESSGNTLTWTKKDGSTGSFTPAGEGGITDVSINGDSIVSEQKAAITTDKQSILFENGVLKLPDEWITYLENVTYKTPTITLSGSGQSVEYGSTVSSINPFSHKETNISNFNGNLTLYRNSTSVLTDIIASESLTNITYSVSDKVTSTISYNLKGTDTKGNTITSGSISFSCYKPCWYGCSQGDKITSVEGLTKLAKSSLGTITFDSEDKDYVFMVVSGTITKVSSGGFEVPTSNIGTITVTLNDEQLTYNVYRTTDSIKAGSNTFDIV